MAPKTFIEMLEAKWTEGKHVCVGLDPLVDKLPANLRDFAQLSGGNPGHFTAQYHPAMMRVVEATKDVAACYKPNWAFFLRRGSKGLVQLQLLVEDIKSTTDVPVILDCKVGDIGATNEGYAEVAFDDIGADAITIHPYLGWEANKPFLDRADKGIFVLCHTSNPGASEFQEVMIMRGNFPETLYEEVALHVADSRTWNQYGNCGLVTGATYPEEIAGVREIAYNLPLLIPGIGKQGGDLEASVKAAQHRFLINSSSGIIFADDPRAETLKLHEGIQSALANIG